MEDVHGCIDALNSLVQKATIGYVPTYVVFHVGIVLIKGSQRGFFSWGSVPQSSNNDGEN